MATAFGIIMGLLLLIFLFRSKRNDYLQQKYKYKLYALRDELRRLEAEKYKEDHLWAYRYFDKALSTTVKKSYHITFFYLAFLFLVHKYDSKTKKAMDKLNGILKDSPELRSISERFIEATHEYVVDQHLVSSMVLKPFIQTGYWAVVLKNMLAKIYVYPETSESYKLANNKMAVA